jgi:hypothetical protein
MDDSLELPDDGLRDRIRKGFEDNATNKSKIDSRPKTPRNCNNEKPTEKTIVPKNTTETEDDKTSPQKKTKSTKPAVKKTVVFKSKSDVTDTMEKLTLKQTKTGAKKASVVEKKTPDKNADSTYLCYKCDKSYKSKSGVIKHMEKCK